MSIIDNKGRLFGIINLFDLVVILVLLTGVVMSLRWINASEDPSWVQVKTFKVRCMGIAQMPVFTAELVREGDRAYNYEKMPTGTIEKILSVKPSPVLTYVSDEGEKVFYDNRVKELTILAELDAYEKKGDIYLAATNGPLRVGDAVTLTTDKYALQLSVRKILKE